MNGSLFADENVRVANWRRASEANVYQGGAARQNAYENINTESHVNINYH